MRTAFLLLLSVTLFSTGNDLDAQQYKLRQSTSIMGMNTESTIYVKGLRKRTESAGMMGQTVLPTIEQCDLQRTITLNDKRKLYFIEPFSRQPEEVIDEDVKAPVKKPVPVVKKDSGGTITMWYNILDTGERKNMYGFTARRIWTTQKIKPSADACSMKDSIIIKTDGWYIDLPQFNCPIRYASTRPVTPNTYQKPDCVDRFITRRSGKGKLGFPLVLKTTMIMGDGKGKTTEFETNLTTLELINGKLDSMLFEIPPGYTEAKSLDEMQEKMDMKSMIKEYEKQARDKAAGGELTLPDDKGKILIGVYQPSGDENVQGQGENLQQYIVANLSNGNYRSIAVANAEEAKAKNCVYVLSTDFQRFKQASKIGGLMKAIKNADPNAASSFNIDVLMTLTKLADGSVRLTEKMSGKYEAKADEVAKRPLQEGCGKLISDLSR